jgi:hypothetical protein
MKSLNRTVKPVGKPAQGFPEISRYETSVEGDDVLRKRRRTTPMTVKVIHEALPGGYDYYCPGCEVLFSFSARRLLKTAFDKALTPRYCPVCGWDTLVKDRTEFEAAYPIRDKRLKA